MRIALALLAAAALFASTRTTARADAPIPACFIQPPGVSAFSSPPVPAASGAGTACAILDKLLESSDETQLVWLPGAVLNKSLGLSTDAFPDGAYAVRFTVTPQFVAAFSGRDALVRFASTEFSAQIGSWWTVTELVTGADGRYLSAAAIASELALPPASLPKIAATATSVASGTVGYFGLVAPAFGQPGGGVQFWFPSEPVRSSAQPLP